MQSRMMSEKGDSGDASNSSLMRMSRIASEMSQLSSSSCSIVARIDRAVWGYNLIMALLLQIARGVSRHEGSKYLYHDPHKYACQGLLAGNIVCPYALRCPQGVCQHSLAPLPASKRRTMLLPSNP